MAYIIGGAIVLAYLFVWSLCKAAATADEALGLK